MFIPAHAYSGAVHSGALVQTGAVHSGALVQTGAVHSGALVQIYFTVFHVRVPPGNSAVDYIIPHAIK